MVCGIDERFEFRDGQGTLGTTEQGRTVLVVDPLDRVRDRLRGWQAWSPVELPRFHGGAIGYQGFDCVRSFQNAEMGVSVSANNDTLTTAWLAEPS